MAYDLGGILSGNKMAGVPLGISLGDGEPDVEGVCSKAGAACLNCTHAITCIALPVGWLMVHLHLYVHNTSESKKLSKNIRQQRRE